MTAFHLRLLTREQASEILGWRYPSPYDFYNPPGDRPEEEYIREFVNPEYQFHGVMDSNESLTGFCSFGTDGQVPGGDYTGDALDIGLGMKPELTGRGLGPSFLAAILRHACIVYAPARFRMTVANFNRRAFRLYSRFGFVKEQEFRDEGLGVSYSVLIRDPAAVSNTVPWV